MPDVTIRLPQPVIDHFDAQAPANQSAEQKMARALKGIAFENEKSRSRANIQSAGQSQQLLENTRLTQVKGDFEL